MNREQTPMGRWWLVVVGVGVTLMTWAAWRLYTVGDAGAIGVAGLWLVVVSILLQQHRRGSKPGVLILGTSSMAARLVEELETPDASRYRFIGAVDDSSDGAGAPGITPILGRLDQFGQIVAATRPRHIVVAMADRRGRVPERILLESRFKGIWVIDAVDFFERVTGKLAIEAMRPASLIMSTGFRDSDSIGPDSLQFLRDAVSRSLALLLLLALSPLLMLIAVAIKLDSAGPILFVQKRVGLAGRPFGLVKFRTMQEAVVPRRSEWVLDNSGRITRVGRWLRRFRLDELPQLVNVVRGEMNLVGPRPHPMSNYELFAKHIPYYEFRSVVRPGITGWAQVRFGYANDLAEETEKMCYDFYYIKHRSLRLDLRIMVETLGVLLFDRRSHFEAKVKAVSGQVAGVNTAS